MSSSQPLYLQIQGNGSGSNLTISSEQTGDFTIILGNLEPVDTRNQAIIATVPPNAQPGDRFAVADSRWNAENNNVTIDFLTNNNLLYGLSNNYGININGGYVEFIFIDSDIGWLAQK